jgi:hypothetical protein
MEPGHSAGEGSPATYEIHLQGTPPEALMTRFAPSPVRRTLAQTVLMRRVASQDELATLLERVLATGLVLNEVHELRMASRQPSSSPAAAGQRRGSRAYEVRVDGKVDGALLRYLQWHHRHLPEQTVLRLQATPEHVHEFVSACCRLGLGIERIRRMTPGGATDPEPSATP